mmetsp:Transcript_34736/g.79271  ORF Transcript_34736/g.79271 Transcript_34736/m.79271 type:complete len:233 (+) Transcript_34736:1323-2021(+)
MATVHRTPDLCQFIRASLFLSRPMRDMDYFVSNGPLMHLWVLAFIVTARGPEACARIFLRIVEEILEPAVKEALIPDEQRKEAWSFMSAAACKHVVIRSPFDPPQLGGAADPRASSAPMPDPNIMVNPRIRRRSRLGRAAGGPLTMNGGEVPGQVGPPFVVAFDGPIVTVVEEEAVLRPPADASARYEDGEGGNGHRRRRVATPPPVKGRRHASVQTDDAPVHRDVRSVEAA